MAVSGTDVPDVGIHQKPGDHFGELKSAEMSSVIGRINVRFGPWATRSYEFGNTRFVMNAPSNPFSNELFRRSEVMTPWLGSRNEFKLNELALLLFPCGAMPLKKTLLLRGARHTVVPELKQLADIESNYRLDRLCLIPMREEP